MQCFALRNTCCSEKTMKRRGAAYCVVLVALLGALGASGGQPVCFARGFRAPSIHELRLPRPLLIAGLVHSCGHSDGSVVRCGDAVFLIRKGKRVPLEYWKSFGISNLSVEEKAPCPRLYKRVCALDRTPGTWPRPWARASALLTIH